MNPNNAAVTMAPTPFLRSLTGKRVIIKTKWGPQYAGTLVSSDNHMNVQLAGCTEYAGKQVTEMESVLIRCNNVLYVRQVPDSVDDAAKILVPTS